MKPLLSRHLRDLPKSVRLIEGVHLIEGVCLIEVVRIAFVNDQHSVVTLYCDKVACCLRNYPEFKFIIFHYQL